MPPGDALPPGTDTGSGGPRGTEDPEGGKKLLVTVWPEPFNFLKTPEEKKQRAMFSFDEDGVVDAVGWMNDRLFENKKLWDEAPSRWDTYQM